MLQVLKPLLILMGMSWVSSCSNEELPSEETQSRSEIFLYAIDSTKQNQDPTQKEELILTGDDILWFNTRTREIKFKDFTPTSEKFPPYKKIEFKLGEQTLFEANAYVNEIFSQVFTDLVIFHDIEKEAYYLNDYYPPINAVRDMEETQNNIKAREKNWNLFLETLKQEKRLK